MKLVDLGAIKSSNMLLLDNSQLWGGNCVGFVKSALLNCFLLQHCVSFLA